MTPSKYQAAIYAEVPVLCEAESGAVQVDAVAGSGKTTTGVTALQKVPSSMRACFVAFSKAIADELGRRVPVGVETKTLNSFGNQIIRKNVVGYPKLNQYKTDDILNYVAGNEAKYLGGPVRKIIGLLKGHAYIYEQLDQSKVIELMDHYDIEYNGKIDKLMKILQDVWLIGVNSNKEIDFDDQLFLPIYKNWSCPKYDLLMVDESQDLNPVQMELIVRSANRIIIVGDTRQAIYGFRGADPQAMENFSQRLNAKKLPLSICYRCAKNVVKEAQKIVPHIEYHEGQIDGVVESIKKDAFRKRAKPGDFVLCRTTAPLVTSCLEFVREGIKATVKGRDIGQNLVNLIQKVIPGQGDAVETGEFAKDLTSYRVEQMAALERANRESRIQTLQDQCDTLMVFVESCKIVGEIKVKISQIFADNVSGIGHMTKHRSKGLETKVVYDLPSTPIKVKREWMVQQEKNLQYVAVTRAQEELYYVTK